MPIQHNIIMRKIETTVLLFALLFVPTLLQAQNIDTLYARWQRVTGTEKLRTGNQLLHLLEKDGLLEKDEVESLDITGREMLIMHGMSEYKYANNDFQGCIAFSNKALKCTPPGNKSWLSDHYNMLSLSYSRLGQLGMAIKFIQKSYEIDSKSGNAEALSSTLNTMAGLYMQVGECATAEKYARKSIEIERELGKKEDRDRQLAIRLGMLSDILLKLDEPMEALQCINEAEQLDRKGGRTEKTGIRLSQKAEILCRLNLWNEAQKCASEALLILQEVGNKVSESIVLKQMAAIAEHKGQIQAAVNYLSECEKICTEINSNYLLQKVYGQFYEIYRNNNPALALQYLEKSVVLKDTIYSLEKQKIISDFQSQYELEQKNAEIANQKSEILMKDHRLAIAYPVLILTGLAALLMAAFILLIVRHNNQQNRVNKMKDDLISLISHEFKNPVIAQNRIIEILEKRHKDMSEEEIAEVFSELKNSSDAHLHLVTNLLQWSMSTMGRFQYSPIRFELSRLIGKTAEQLRTQMTGKQISLSIPEGLFCFVYADIAMVEVVIRNILSNAIKFSFPGQCIEIRIEDKGGKAVVTVTDHGIGMSKQVVSRLMRKGRWSANGTSGEQGTGLGLQICRNLVEKNGGTLVISSEEQKGTSVAFDLKKADQAQVRL